jgi:hypothetical protein
MAYMSQDRKKVLTPAIKAVLKKYNLKGSISVQNYSTLRVTISSGDIDFLAGKDCDHGSVNPYWIANHFTGIAKDCLLELKAAMMTGNHDNSDIMTDYFDVGWYIDIKIGNWDKPYNFTGEIEFA